MSHASVPRMLRHARSNRAFVVVRDEQNRRRQVTLGAWGSAESRRAYADVLSKFANRHGGALLLDARATAGAEAKELTIGGMVARYLTWAETYYVSHVDGLPTGEAANMELAATPLLRLYADEPAREFGLADLRRVREALIAVEENGRPLARPPCAALPTTNKRWNERTR